MRRLAIFPFVMLVVACADTVTEPVTDPPAPAFSEQDKGAVVHYDNVECALMDGEGHWFPEDFSLPCGLELATYATGLNAILSVHATGAPPGPTGRTVHWGPYNPGADWAAAYNGSLGIKLSGPPYPCWLLGTDYNVWKPLYTINWQAWVTPSGEASLVCNYSEKWEFNCEDYGNCA